MKALTLRQPWASAIIHGRKRVENRTWLPRQLRDDEPLWVALHAGKGTDDPFADVQTVWEYAQTSIKLLGIDALGRRPEDYPRGILGLVRFDRGGDIEKFPELADDPLATGPKVWLVGAVLPLPEPIPIKGAQGLWPVPDEVARDIEAKFPCEELGYRVKRLPEGRKDPTVVGASFALTRSRDVALEYAEAFQRRHPGETRDPVVEIWHEALLGGHKVSRLVERREGGQLPLFLGGEG